MYIFKKIWALYASIVFFLLWVIFFPFYYLAFLFFPKKWRKYIIWFSHHIYTRIYFGLTLVFFEIEGKEHISASDTYIIVSNHRSVLDFMINARAYPGVYKFLAKKELVKVPVFGFIVRKLCVLVDRSSRASRLASMKYLRQTIEEGYSIFIYPEGTRNNTTKPLLNFHRGAFKMAIESGRPIAVQVILGIERLLPIDAGFALKPGKIKVVWSKPIPVEGMTEADIPKLSQKVREVMLEKLGASEGELVSEK